MITGTYRFYENGELISEKSNLITTNGKSAITRYFAGIINNICSSIAVGIDDIDAAALGDIALGFEIGRSTVTNIGADLTNNLAIFKTTLPAELVGSIREVGAFTIPSNIEAGAFTSKAVFSMDSSENWGAATFTTTNTRGSQSVHLNPALSATASADLTGASLDLSGYSSSDKFLMAFYVADANCASVTVKIGSDASNYAAFTSTAPAAGYHVVGITKGSAAITGAPNWSSISYIHIDVTATSGGATSVDFDGMRVEDMDSLSQTYALVSHSVLASPVVKKSGVPMDIEYALGITL